jgi:hypothetical protein
VSVHSQGGSVSVYIFEEACVVMGVDLAWCSGGYGVNGGAIKLILWIRSGPYTLILVNTRFMDVLAEWLGHIIILTSEEGGPADIRRTYFSPNFTDIYVVLVSGDLAQKDAEDIVARFSIFVLVGEKLKIL